MSVRSRSSAYHGKLKTKDTTNQNPRGKLIDSRSTDRTINLHDLLLQNPDTAHCHEPISKKNHTVKLTMALPLPPGLTPPEVAFVCEMEMVTIIPRQRLDRLELLGGPIPALRPPNRATLPLWLALLLKRQHRANILPPPWLTSASLESILDLEINLASFTPAPSLASASSSLVSPPFLPSATDAASPDALPYHWLELGEMLLDAAADDIPDPDAVRRLLRDLREVRMAKMRAGVTVLEGGREVKMNGVGAMEVAEGRAFILGVVDGLRKLGASKELSRREREAEERENGLGGGGNEDEDDEMDMR